MNILITGASGFVGSNLIKFFSGLGYSIDVLDLGQPMGAGVRSAFHWKDIDSVNFDIYNAVIHLAGMAHDTGNKSEGNVYMDVNYGLTKRVLDKFVGSGAGSFVFFSSVKAVANVVVGDVLTEDVVPAPVGPYGVSKARAEGYILDALGGGLQQRVYILRPCMIHGPGNKGNLNLLYKVVKSGLPWPLGAFSNLRSFTSIDNLTFLIDKILVSSIPSGVYNVADDQPLSTNRLIELIAESQGRRPRIWNLSPGFISGIARLGSVLHLPLNTQRLNKLTENYIVSNTKLKLALGIDTLPTTPQDGIRTTLSSFK